MAPIYWLIAFVVFIGIELPTLALTTIWFAGGALVAFILAMLGASLEVQLFVFVIVSFLLLFFTRPFVSRYINGKTIKTNVDDLIGRHARVTVEVNNPLSTGAVVVNGQEWTARSLAEKEVIPVEAEVVIREIRGVKLIVEEIQEEN